MAFELTHKGEERALEIREASGPEAATLAFLYKTGRPTEVEEIMDETRMDDEKAVKVLGRLVGQGYVEET